MDSWDAMITKEELGIRDEPVKVLRASLAGSARFSTGWKMNSDCYLYLPTFSNALSNRLSISFSISFKYYFFIHYLLFF